MNRGLTIIEISIIIGILGILVATAPLSFNLYKSEQLNNYTQRIIYTLRKAQTKAMATEADSSFGVYLTKNSYTLFRGSSYANRDTSLDQVFHLPSVISLSGPQELVFSKSEGLPSTTGTISLYNNIDTNNITINEIGRINFELPLAYCSGEPLSCDQFVDQSTCQSQDGCSWSVASCGGTCTPCNQLARTQCIQQEGCRWIGIFCLGTCTSCDTYSNETDCNNQLGCSWNPAICQGTAQACDTYTTQQDCESQAGCQWLIP